MSENSKEGKFDDNLLDKLEEFDNTFKVAKICGVSCNLFNFKSMNSKSSELSLEENKCLGISLIKCFYYLLT